MGDCSSDVRADSGGHRHRGAASPLRRAQFWAIGTQCCRSGGNRIGSRDADGDAWGARRGLRAAQRGHSGMPSRPAANRSGISWDQLHVRGILEGGSSNWLRHARGGSNPTLVGEARAGSCFHPFNSSGGRTALGDVRPLRLDATSRLWRHSVGAVRSGFDVRVLGNPGRDRRLPPTRTTTSLPRGAFAPRPLRTLLSEIHATSSQASPWPMLSVDQLKKRYRGGRVANDEITMTAEAGEILGVLGPNGAGKSTLVKQVVGLLKPTSGSIRIEDVDVAENPRAARALCSYQPQSPLVAAALPVRRAIEMAGQMRGGEGKCVRRRTEELMSALQIAAWAEVPSMQLSGGVRRLVSFCMATVSPGRVVILDEPTDDVDPARRVLLWREVRRVAEQGTAVLLVTHNVVEAERAVDRIALLNEGRVRALGRPAELVGTKIPRVEVRAGLGTPLPEPPRFASYSMRDGHRGVLRIHSTQLPDVVGWCQETQAQGAITDYRITTPTLEQAYMRLVEASDATSGGAT
jgi:ABC-2 type transport system ATP-binding protein